MAYTPQTWTDSPATSTPISAARLTVIENGIAAAATLTGTETLTNKTMSGASNTFSNISADAIIDGSANKVFTTTMLAKLNGIVITYIDIDTYGGDPTGVTSSSAALAAARTALGSAPGVIRFGPGVYRLTAPCPTPFIQNQGVIGVGVGATRINYSGTGHLFEAHDTRTYVYGVSPEYGGPFTGFVVDGTSAGANSAALCLGDLYAPKIDIEARNFTATGSVGVLFENHVTWAERIDARISVQNCRQGVVFNPTTGYPSHDYSRFQLSVIAQANQDGVVLRGNCDLLGCDLHMVGNFQTGVTNTGTALIIGGDGPSDTSRLHGASVHIACETGGNTGVGHKTITVNGTAKLQGVGVLKFSNGNGVDFQTGSARARTAFTGFVDVDADLGRAGYWQGSRTLGVATGSPGYLDPSGVLYLADNGNLFIRRMNAGALTLSLDPGVAALAGQAIAFDLILQQPVSGSTTLTWPGSFVWPTGAPPTLSTTANGYDIIHVVSADCGTFFATHMNPSIAGNVTLTGAQTLTNKTLTAPVINSPTGIVKGDVGLGNVTNNAQYFPGGTDVAIIDGGTGVSTLPAGLLVGAGTGAITAKTAPAGTLVGDTDAQALTNKIISGTSNTLSNIPQSAVTNLNGDLNWTIRENSNHTVPVGRTYWRNKADTASPQTTEDTGQTVSYANFGTNGALKVLGGQLTASNPRSTSGTSSGFLVFAPGVAVTRIGGRFTFNGGTTTGGSFTMAMMNETLNLGSGTLRFGVHFYCGPHGWGLQTYNNNTSTFTDLAGGTWGTDFLVDGTAVHEAELYRVGNTATVRLPNGVVASVTDANIGAWSGNFGFVESGHNAGTTDAIIGITEHWWDTGTQIPPLASGTTVTLGGIQTLAGKRIDLSVNALTMTKAQLNTAVTDADVVTLTGTETLTNKTINGANNTVTGLTPAAVSATGTPSTTTFWRGDNAWAVPAGGGTVTPSSTDTFTNKLIGDKLDFASVTAPVAPAAGSTRFYSRVGVSGLDAPAWVGSLGVPIVIGRDICFFAKNITGSTITKGSVVYVQSATASVVNIAKALADSGGTKLPAIGVMAADVTNNSFGMVMQYGVIQAINTSGMGDGAIIYLDPTTPGAFTATRPAHPNVGQMIGVVVNANTSGTLLVTCTPTNTSLIQGTNNASWGIGDGTTSSARSIAFKNSNTGTLQWTPTATRTLTLPDATGTLYVSGGTDVAVADGGTGASTAAGALTNLAIPADFVYVATGNVARAVGSGDFTIGQYIGRAFTLTKVIYQFDTADASGSTSVEVRRNGSAVTNSSATVTAANQADGTGTDAARTVTPSQAFAVGDRLLIQITAVGTTPGKGLRAYLLGTWS